MPHGNGIPSAGFDFAGFDFTAAMRHLCQDMASRLPELGHIDLSRVAFSFSQARKRVSHGLHASLTPMRFAGGAQQSVIRGRRYRVSTLAGPAGHEMLYILSFYLPRFMDTTLEEKLSTTLHELWHIGPQFDGDLRRHEGRCYAHGGSQREYDLQMEQLSQRWLAEDPPLHVYEFLQLSFDELVAEHGKVHGTRVRTPKLIPMDAA